MRVVFVAGPPRSGKDTVANMVTKFLLHDPWFAVHIPSSRDLKKAIHTALGLELQHDYYEDKKDESTFDFFHKTPREVYIKFVSFLTQTFSPGDNSVLGHILLRRIRYLHVANVVVVSGVGHNDEVAPIVKRYGADNCLVLQLFRPGAEYNDGREPITISGVRTELIKNVADKEILERLVISKVTDWLGIPDDGNFALDDDDA